MAKRTSGTYERANVGGEEVTAFIPYALPPLDPPILVDAALAERVRAAEQALFRLELAGEMVPSLDWFIYAFVRKEAVLSSQIEGTQATLVDLLTFEAQGSAEQSAPPNADVEEVCNYLEALTYARAQLADPKGARRRAW
jgi:Fic family protein